MTRERKTDKEVIEPTEPLPPEPVFDFTQPVAAFDAETKRAYHLLRRVAILAKDEKGLPDNKIYTLSEVVTILGEDYAQSQVINAGCC